LSPEKVPLSGVLTVGAPWGKVLAHLGAVLIDAASDLLPDLPREGNAPPIPFPHHGTKEAVIPSHPGGHNFVTHYLQGYQKTFAARSTGSAVVHGLTPHQIAVKEETPERT